MYAYIGTLVGYWRAQFGLSVEAMGVTTSHVCRQVYSTTQGQYVCVYVRMYICILYE